MKTRLIKLVPGKSVGQAIKEAGQVLGAGGLVAIPTETVYGIAANAADSAAIKKLRRLKERSKREPFTLLIAEKEQASNYAGQLSWPGTRLAERGWPGPLTLVFDVGRRRPAGRKELTAAQAKNIYHRGTVGLRCPDQQEIRKLLSELDFPVVAPSANRKGQAPAVQAGEVLAALDGELELVLDGGSCRYGRASTVVEVKSGQYRIIRQGVLDERIIGQMARLRIMFVCTGNTCRSPMAVGLFRLKAAQKLGCKPEELPQRGLEVFSSGTIGLSGVPASANAIEAAGELGAQISQHLSEGLNKENIGRADHILVMTRGHLQEVLRLVPEAKNKTKCLDPRGDISDPMGLDLQGYRQCAGRLAKSIEHLVKELKI